tara:strand:+ start:9086 stop:9925 length:840 start_codon:yes stop_codon:yes gene_type:complete
MWVYLNGDFLESSQAKISPLDRGFTFGEGVYEVIPSYGKNFFLFHEHFNRLKSSLEQTFIPYPEELSNLQDILSDLYDRNGFSNQYFYIQVTRGVQEFRSHQDNSIKAPTVFITSQNLELNPYRINPDKKGLRVRLEEDIRWARCDIKTTGLIGNVIPLHDQTKDQVDEIIFHKDERINEGSKSNVFFVKDSVVYTPSLKQNILPGVTRAFVIELLKKNKIPLFEESIPLSFIHDSDEIWLTSSTKEIQPIEIIDDYKLPKKNSDLLIWKRLLNSFNQL